MTRKAKPGADLGLQMVEPCPVTIVIGKATHPCIFEHGHKADGSTVLAFHKTAQGDTWATGTTAFQRARKRSETYDDLEAAGGLPGREQDHDDAVEYAHT